MIWYTNMILHFHLNLHCSHLYWLNDKQNIWRILETEEDGLYIIVWTLLFLNTHTHTHTHIPIREWRRQGFQVWCWPVEEQISKLSSFCLFVCFFYFFLPILRLDSNFDIWHRALLISPSEGQINEIFSWEGDITTEQGSWKTNKNKWMI